MKKMKQYLSVLLIGILSLISVRSGAQSLNYDTIPGDPLNARIYTLENGLKVYLTVYKDEPRFQSMIGVKAGSKHDPKDHTGLAHYLEHMLFKGTDVYGTLNYTVEKPLLDSIVKLYDKYGSTTDTLERKRIYQSIDSISGIAARFAIPNEFDKMMAGMGVTGVNAYTSNEQTVYINNVPSNQLENFIQVEAERFRNPVFRLFHTELEAVYEEKNRGLDNDNRKMWESLYSGLFPNHQYGTQTTIGTIEHLKNPSLTAIRDYFNTYYVPNNMVISLSGDFDPESAIRSINEQFGKMKPKEVPAFKVAEEKFIKVPVVKEVYGPDAESLMIGFRFKGASSEEADVLTMVDLILSNGQAGLLDLNLNKKQKVLNTSSSVDIMKDYSVHVLSGRPREGQSLEEVKKLMFDQLMEIKMGNFPDWLLPAIITNLRLDQQREFENNMRRASAMLNPELDGVRYADAVQRIDRLSRINKQQIIDFVRTWYGDNYVVVYKRIGVDEDVIKVTKPAITPVVLNKEQQSEFAQKILSSRGEEIKPEFIEYKTAISSTTLKGVVPVYMVKNTENDLFSLKHTVYTGFAHDKRLSVLAGYLNYLGTGKYSSEAIQEAFYKIGCSFSASVSEDEFTVNLNGLATHFNEAVVLLESVMADARPDEPALQNLISDLEKRRANAKLNKSEILNRLTNYAKYGPVSPATWILSKEELKALKGSELTGLLARLFSSRHHIDYYGPADSLTVVSVLLKNHKVYRSIKDVQPVIRFEELSTADGNVYFMPYEMKQAEVNFLSKGGVYDEKLQPVANLYSRYFGGGMSSPVFQTLRESKALAYAVSSRYIPPARLDRSYYNTAYIGTQSDKLEEAMEGMMELLQQMPVSSATFQQAKDGALQAIVVDRITKTEILQTYHAARKLGQNGDFRSVLYAEMVKLTMDDIVRFHEKYLKGKKYRIAVIGSQDKIDLNVLKSYGHLEEVTMEMIFGY